MGIDAEILVRKVPEDVVTDDWLKEVSWRLCRSIGARHFFIGDGLPETEYVAAIGAWNAAFDAHPLHAEWQLARVKCEWDRKMELHERIFADIGKPPERMRLAVSRTLSYYREADDPAPGSVYHQDGDDINAAEGECLLELSLWGRYYGEGYERGDILTYCAIAEWLEANIPGCEVWYGGDSSGACAEPFTAERRYELRKHLYSNQGRDYFNYGWGSGDVKPPACSLCPGGKYCGTQHGTGLNYAAFSCGGCGKAVSTRDNGATWLPEKD